MFPTDLTDAEKQAIANLHPLIGKRAMFNAKDSFAWGYTTKPVIVGNAYRRGNHGRLQVQCYIPHGGGYFTLRWMTILMYDIAEGW